MKVIFLFNLGLLLVLCLCACSLLYRVSLVVVQAPKFMAQKTVSRDPVSSILGLNRCPSCKEPGNIHISDIYILYVTLSLNG